MVDLAEQLTPQPGGVLRTGRLVGISGTALTVDIGGGEQVDMPYLDPYLPLLGDTVQVLQQGAVPLVLGAPAGMADDNVLANPSFEIDPPGSTVTSWTNYVDPASIGSATVTVDTATAWGPKHGVQWLEINHAIAGYVGNYQISEAIAVQPGQRWSAVGYAVSSVEGGSDQPTMSIRLTFYATAAGTYPTNVVSSDTLQIINGPTGPWWVPVRAITGTGTVVPDGVTAMRVVLVTETYGGSVYWDKILCRRLA